MIKRYDREIKIRSWENNEIECYLCHFIYLYIINFKIYIMLKVGTNCKISFYLKSLFKKN